LGTTDYRGPFRDPVSGRSLVPRRPEEREHEHHEEAREEAEASRQRYIECDVRFADSTVVRVLSHEEAKRKAAAVALLKHAEWCRANKQGTWSSVANAEAEAEKLWPALFHAGDGRKPRGK